MNMRYQLLAHRNVPRGFTLVELLIAISIMGILASMVLFTLGGAQREAKITKTRTTIEKINAVLMERFEEYRYRSVKLQIPISLTQKNPNSNIVPLSPRNFARIRAVVLKDLMRMEMPDRQSDLEYTPTNVFFSITDPQTGNATTVSLDSYSGRYSPREYHILRSYFDLPAISDPWVGPVAQRTPLQLTPPQPYAWTPEWESAECLYAILAHSTVAGGPALENFHPSEVGDKDNDGYLEFWDAWEKPIGWLRWPAGYESALNNSYKAMVTNGSGALEPSSPDAFDPYRTHTYWTSSPPAQKPWTLVPLVISAGPDGEFGIDSSVASPYAITQDPYFAGNPSAAPTVGATVDAALMQDNISSHDLLLE